MKIAAFAHTLDPLFIKNVPSHISLYLLVADSASPWLLKQIRPDRIITFTCDLKDPLSELSDTEIIKRSDVTQKILKYKISAFMVSHRGSKFLQTWAIQNKITLLSPLPKHQIQFEDKGWFNAFLARYKFPKPKGAIQTGSGIRFKKSMVIQELRSFGSFGTHLVRTKNQYQHLRTKKIIYPNKRYLVRELIQGKTYGITVYIDENHIILSACRLQCFYNTASIQPTFAGVQWIPTRMLGRKAIDAINDTFVQLGFLMHSIGYRGYANFDFILSPRSEVSILECNPRLSSATPQIFAVHELTGGFDTASLFLRMPTVDRSIEVSVSGLPDSSYAGSLLDILALPTTSITPRTIKHGVYIYTGTTFSFTSSKLTQFFRNTRSVLFTGIDAASTKVEAGDTIGTIISHFPLFTPQGTLTAAGEKAATTFNALQ